jgi:hypothetical protein
VLTREGKTRIGDRHRRTKNGCHKVFGKKISQEFLRTGFDMEAKPLRAYRRVVVN